MGRQSEPETLLRFPAVPSLGMRSDGTGQWVLPNRWESELLFLTLWKFFDSWVIRFLSDVTTDPSASQSGFEHPMRSCMWRYFINEVTHMGTLLILSLTIWPLLTEGFQSLISQWSLIKGHLCNTYASTSITYHSLSWFPRSEILPERKRGEREADFYPEKVTSLSTPLSWSLFSMLYAIPGTHWSLR